MHFITSIFDTNQENYHLWYKQDKLPGFNPTARDCFSAVAYKPKNEATQLVKRLFFIKGNFLCYKRKKSSGAYSGVIDLNWVRAEFITEENEVLKHSYPCYVRFIKEEKYTSVYFKSIKEAANWRQALKKIVTMTDFHGRYGNGELIGKGAYAKVEIFFFRFIEIFCIIFSICFLDK